MTTFEQRVAELKDFERTEGIPLPLCPWRIIELEDQGYIVDLETGEVCSVVTVVPTRHAKAVCHLLEHEQGTVAI